MICKKGNFFVSFFRTERNVDYQSKYNSYMEKLENVENADEKVKIVKNILSVIIDYLNFDEDYDLEDLKSVVTYIDDLFVDYSKIRKRLATTVVQSER